MKKNKLNFYRIYVCLGMHFSIKNYHFNNKSTVRGLGNRWNKFKSKESFNVAIKKVGKRQFIYLCISSYIFKPKMYILEMISKENIDRYEKFIRWHQNKIESYKKDIAFILNEHVDLMFKYNSINVGFKNIIQFFIQHYENGNIGFDTICYINILYPKTTSNLDTWNKKMFVISKYKELITFKKELIVMVTKEIVSDFYSSKIKTD